MKITVIFTTIFLSGLFANAEVQGPRLLVAGNSSIKTELTDIGVKGSDSVLLKIFEAAESKGMKVYENFTSGGGVTHHNGYAVDLYEDAEMKVKLICDRDLADFCSLEIFQSSSFLTITRERSVSAVSVKISGKEGKQHGLDLLLRDLFDISVKFPKEFDLNESAGTVGTLSNLSCDYLGCDFSYSIN